MTVSNTKLLATLRKKYTFRGWMGLEKIWDRRYAAAFPDDYGIDNYWYGGPRPV